MWKVTITLRKRVASGQVCLMALPQYAFPTKIRCVKLIIGITYNVVQTARHVEETDSTARSPATFLSFDRLCREAACAQFMHTIAAFGGIACSQGAAAKRARFSRNLSPRPLFLEPLFLECTWQPDTFPAALRGHLSAERSLRPATAGTAILPVSGTMLTTDFNRTFGRPITGKLSRTHWLGTFGKWCEKTPLDDSTNGSGFR